MKKAFFIVLLSALACAGFAQSQLYHYEDSMLAIKAEQAYDHVDTYSRYYVNVEMPKVEGAVRDSIVGWLNTVFATDSGVVITDVDKLIRNSIERFRASEMEDRKACEISMPYEYQTEVSLVTMNSQYVTLLCNDYLYLGGAHGVSAVYGATFRMSDGKHLLWDDMFFDRDAVRPFLTKAFNTLDRDERPEWDLVYEYTESSADTYPMPTNNPYLVENQQLMFIYQSYEIGPYAMGMPSCSIPATELKDILKPDFLKLVAP